MALINCPECGHEISDKAHSCPNCGYPIEENSYNNSLGEKVDNDFTEGANQDHDEQDSNNIDNNGDKYVFDYREYPMVDAVSTNQNDLKKGNGYFGNLAIALAATALFILIVPVLIVGESQMIWKITAVSLPILSIILATVDLKTSGKNLKTSISFCLSGCAIILLLVVYSFFTTTNKNKADYKKPDNYKYFSMSSLPDLYFPIASAFKPYEDYYCATPDEDFVSLHFVGGKFNGDFESAAKVYEEQIIKYGKADKHFGPNKVNINGYSGIEYRCEYKNGALARATFVKVPDKDAFLCVYMTQDPDKHLVYDYDEAYTYLIRNAKSKTEVDKILIAEKEAKEGSITSTSKPEPEVKGKLETKTDKFAGINVSVVSKSRQPEDISNFIYHDTSIIVFRLTNNSKQSIKAVKGIITIRDLFGEQLIKSPFSLVGDDVEVGGRRDTRLTMEVSVLDDGTQAVYNENYNDLKFEIELTDVIYSINSKGGLTENTGKTDSVRVRVSKMVTYPIDIYSGRYHPFVEFVIEAENKTDKTIKGIQGTLIIKDIFGDIIERIQFNLTGQNIKGKGKVSFSGTGLEVNIVDDSDLKIYQSEPNDLQFEYVITDVVFN